MDRMRSFFHKTPTTSTISTRPVFTGHRISPDVVRLMATFLEVEDINALGRTNRTWRQTLYSSIRSLNLDCKNLSLHPPSRQERMKVHLEIFARTLSHSVSSPPDLPRCWYAWPLQDFTALQSLSVSHIRNDDSFGFIGSLTTLQCLRVRYCSITDSGLKALSSLMALKNLKLAGHLGFMTYTGVAELWPLPLKKLTLTDFTSSSSRDVKVLTCLRTLSKLTFCHCIITHAGKLIRITTLQNLKFKCCYGVTFDDIYKLIKFSALQLDHTLTRPLRLMSAHVAAQNFSRTAHAYLKGLNQIKEWAAERRGEDESNPIGEDESNPILQWCDLYFTRQS